MRITKRNLLPCNLGALGCSQNFTTDSRTHDALYSACPHSPTIYLLGAQKFFHFIIWKTLGESCEPWAPLPPHKVCTYQSKVVHSPTAHSRSIILSHPSSLVPQSLMPATIHVCRYSKVHLKLAVRWLLLNTKRLPLGYRRPPPPRRLRPPFFPPSPYSYHCPPAKSVCLSFS